jgi:glycosyltransferase involved in cell wall biosynthesis
VLDALRAQTLAAEKWELIVFDNGSREPLSHMFDLSSHPVARHVVLPELGLLSARLFGIREAKADLLVFVEDDCLLVPSYWLRLRNDTGPKCGNIASRNASVLVGAVYASAPRSRKPTWLSVTVAKLISLNASKGLHQGTKMMNSALWDVPLGSEWVPSRNSELHFSFRKSDLSERNFLGLLESTHAQGLVLDFQWRAYFRQPLIRPMASFL